MLFTTQPTTSDDWLDELMLQPLKNVLSIDFPEHDSRLRNCIEAAIGLVEGWCDRALVPRTLKVTLTGPLDAGERLPLRTITAVTDITRSDTVDTTADEFFLGDYRTLRKTLPAGLTLEMNMEVGYDPMPPAIQQAVVIAAANLFDGQTRPWKPLVRQYRAVTYAMP